LVDFSTVTASDGTVTVTLAGGTPLVIGQQVNPLSLSASGGAQSPPPAEILDSQGDNVTAQATGGQLGGLLNVQNGLLASYIGDSQQQGSLNELAQSLADTINGILESGTVSTASGAASGSALFTYNAVNPTGVAASLKVNPNITPDQLAPVDPSGAANGNANALAALSSAPSLNGMSFTQYYSQMAAAVGQQNSDATSNQTTQQQALAQAESLRDSVSGVSLDDQAVQVLQFQQAYQASAQVLSVLNTLAQATIDLIPIL
jgi:flagellar hook-associated protein 1 FlgK